MLGVPGSQVAHGGQVPPGVREEWEEGGPRVRGERWREDRVKGCL